MLTKKTWIISIQEEITFYSLWHVIKNKSGPKIEPFGTQQDADAGWEKLFPKLPQKKICWKDKA